MAAQVGPSVLGHLEPEKGREGTGTGWWAGNEEVGRGQEPNPSLWKLAQMRCPGVFWGVGVGWR